MKNDKGGPAFPGPASEDATGSMQENNKTSGAQVGMTLRDYFAAKALQGWLAGSEIENPRFGNDANGKWGPIQGSTFNHEAMAEEAYAFADAMLSERAKD